MKRLHFSATIEAPRRIVWDVMLGPDTFSDWTAAFGETTHFEGSWAAGDRIRFLAPGGSGMTSVIAENREHEFLSIKHLGSIKDGVEDTESEAVRAWAPAFENYALADEGGATRLEVEMDVAAAFEDFMAKAWPNALARLKAISEARAGTAR